MNRIRLFVDDEREPFEGWTLARNYLEAMEYFDHDSGYDIQALSLDWHLGEPRLCGLVLAEEMLSRVRLLRLDVFRNTEEIWLHSSVREMATRQARLFETAKKQGLVNPRCRVRLNQNCRFDLSWGDD